MPNTASSCDPRSLAQNTVPERERVLRLLIERVDYDGRDGTLKLTYRLAGFAQLVAEVATEEAS